MIYSILFYLLNFINFTTNLKLLPEKNLFLGIRLKLNSVHVWAHHLTAPLFPPPPPQKKGRFICLSCFPYTSSIFIERLQTNFPILQPTPRFYQPFSLPLQERKAPEKLSMSAFTQKPWKTTEKKTANLKPKFVIKKNFPKHFHYWISQQNSEQTKQLLKGFLSSIHCGNTLK